MVPPVIAALANVLGSTLSTEVWDGEVMRYDSKGKPINPESTTGNWPAIGVMMESGAAKRKRMFRGEYIDLVSVNAQVWGTERDQEEPLSRTVDILLQRASTWDQMTQVMKNLDPRVIRVVHARVDTGSSTQEKDVRTGQSKLLYLGDIRIEVRVHGKMPVQ